MAKGRDHDVDHACKVRPRQLWPCSAVGFLVLITVPAAAAAVGLLMSDDLLSGVDSERNHFHLFNLNNHLGNGNHTDGQGGSADPQRPQEAPCGGGGDTPNYKPPWGWSASVKTVVRGSSNSEGWVKLWSRHCIVYLNCALCAFNVCFSPTSRN